MRDLAAPDAIFIGGGGSRDGGVFEACWAALKPGGRLVVNAVTLETERAILGWHAAHGGSLKRIALSHLEPVGSLHGLAPGHARHPMVGGETMIVAGIGMRAGASAGRRSSTWSAARWRTRRSGRAT